MSDLVKFESGIMGARFGNMPMQAYMMAFGAHAGQKRKYTDQPYITHPLAVAQIAFDATLDTDVLCASFLHDVVEDTPLEINDIEYHFGNRVADLVYEVTDVSKPEDGNRATRKAMDREHLRKASPDGKTIKLADMIHNSQSIVKLDPNFAKVYMEEKRLLLPALIEGHEGLWRMAENMVHNYFEGA